ncbi:hypothetical protein ABK046_46765, partial [Streptomyces caeruleatus]
PDAKAQKDLLALELQKFKLELAQELGALKLAEQQAKSAQNLALGDIKAAEAVQKQMRFPRSDYANRR